MITKRARPVAKLVPIDDEPMPRSTMGSVHLVIEADEDHCSTAAHLSSPLVTRDQRIRIVASRHKGIRTIW